MCTQKGIKKETADKLVRELLSFDFIGFAVVFGSIAEGRETDISDIDIGIYTLRDVPLIDIGLVSARCEVVLMRKADVVVLNNLYKRKPVLAYEIASKGNLLFCRKQDDFVGFKKNSFLYYLDTIPLRTAVDKRFRERLSSGKFGERNYAGTG